ncbi:extracellular solute-binding protein [Fervidibacillus halotolerans]|uniref:Extracellular solute-binding protein n=1 Tax=Fervidibacillus halotolerans TaxID=2980027 RepID=A0A9E8M3S4_9BACI|nr:extracellular solute-binding protein [Fervidibacillus halotolerans]WAA13869.1 extracellular solute-binding protein [Fervidibacillus halotolerans]
MLVLLIPLTGCQGSGDEASDDSENENVVEFEFWAAPNPTQEAFWKGMAEEYMKENKNVKINVSPMPESPSSEAGIQAAIASGSAPAASENISRGFAAQLSDSQAIVPLDEFEGYDDLIANRNMEGSIAGWEFADGHQYVLPIYSNAMMFAWRLDILKELGYKEPPKTYSEVIEVGQKLKEKYPDKFLWARADLVQPTWWARWFDFFMIYNAASGGANFTSGSDFVADRDAGIKTLTFFKDLNDNELVLTREATDPFETGMSIMMDIGPWTFPYWAEKFPELKYNETYTLSMPPVPDDVNPADSKTFADTKGIVIYSQASEEQQKAAFDFLTWVYSNPENDLTWFEKTNLPPARDDLSTNEAFLSYLEESPQLNMFAENIPNATPAIDNEKFVEIQEEIGKQALNPIMKGDKDPEKAWDDMVDAISGVLK